MARLVVDVEKGRKGKQTIINNKEELVSDSKEKPLYDLSPIFRIELRAMCDNIKGLTHKSKASVPLVIQEIAVI